MLNSRRTSSGAAPYSSVATLSETIEELLGGVEITGGVPLKAQG